MDKKIQKNAGIISKSYDLKKSLVEDFKKACDKKNTTQTAEIRKFIEDFIKKNS